MHGATREANLQKAMFQRFSIGRFESTNRERQNWNVSKISILLCVSLTNLSYNVTGKLKQFRWTVLSVYGDKMNITHSGYTVLWDTPTMAGSKLSCSGTWQFVCKFSCFSLHPPRVGIIKPQTCTRNHLSCKSWWVCWDTDLFLNYYTWESFEHKF